MSQTTIYKIEKNGDVIPYEDIKDANRIAMTIWHIMFESYNDLIQNELERPEWFSETEPITFDTIQITGQMNQFWGLFKKTEIERNDRLVFGFTFGDVIVLKSDIPELIEAHKDFIEFFKTLEPYKSIDFSGLETLIKYLEELSNEKYCIGVASSNSYTPNHWVISDEDSEYEEWKEEKNVRVYNIYKNTKHWDLFGATNTIDLPKVGDKLYLDDDREFRNPPDDSWIRIYSYKEFVAYIEAYGLPEAISFDHDLGEDENGKVLPTGKDCANWLVAYCIENDLELPMYDCHSANPCGWENIKGLLDNYSKFRKMNKK